MQKSKVRGLLSSNLLFVALLCLFGCSSGGGNSETFVTIPEPLEIPPIGTDTIYIERIVDRIPLKPINELMVDEAMKYLGVKEVNGSNSGPIVDKFFIGCGVPPGNPWCACFANSVLISVGGQGPQSPAWSPSWFPNSKTYWTRGIDPENITFRPGSTFGIYFNSLKRIAHVGIVAKDFGDGYVLTIEGNTNSAGGREGDGVYMRIRHKSTIYKVSYWL